MRIGEDGAERHVLPGDFAEEDLALRAGLVGIVEGIDDNPNHLADDRSRLNVSVLVHDEEHVHQVDAGSERLCNEDERQYLTLRAVL